MSKALVFDIKKISAVLTETFPDLSEAAIRKTVTLAFSFTEIVEATRERMKRELSQDHDLISLGEGVAVCFLTESLLRGHVPTVEAVVSAVHSVYCSHGKADEPSTGTSESN